MIVQVNKPHSMEKFEAKPIIGLILAETRLPIIEYIDNIVALLLDKIDLFLISIEIGSTKDILVVIIAIPLIANNGLLVNIKTTELINILITKKIIIFFCPNLFVILYDFTDISLII